jgi:TPP-dependent pyruvate/acetoin dehydrogenase alpha subunit
VSRDGITQFENYLTQREILTDDVRSEYRDMAAADVEAAVEWAQDQPYPDGAGVADHVFARPRGADKE